MTTFINFVPSQVQAPQFNVNLDGNEYLVTVEWVLFAQRYYIRINDLTGALVLYTALIGSPIGINIAALSWANGRVTVTLDSPHFFQLGQVVNLTIEGATPNAYNGIVQAFITDRATFTYQLATDPGVATVLGSAQQNINLVGGLFTSTLVYRQQNAQFEVSN